MEPYSTKRYHPASARRSFQRAIQSLKKSLISQGRRFSTTALRARDDAELGRRSEMCRYEGANKDSVARPTLTFSFRSSARSLKGRTHTDQWNQDAFVRYDDISILRSRALLNAACTNAFGRIGFFGVFDGHGGASCSTFLSKNLATAVAHSSAWDKLRNHDPWTKRSRYGVVEDQEESKTETKEMRREGVSIMREGLNSHLVQEVMEQALMDGFKHADQTFIEHAKETGRNSGSTAVVALVWGRWLALANVGDSEAFFYNDPATTEEHARAVPCVYRTQRHDFTNESERKRVQAAGGFFVQKRVLGRLQPTRGFGNWDVRSMQDGIVVAVPDVSFHQVTQTTGSAFVVLGSDGLWQGITEEKIVDAVRGEKMRERTTRRQIQKPSRVARILAEEAFKVENDDDTTAVVITFESGSSGRVSTN